MSKVNYVREMEGFAAWAEANSLSGSERLLWQALFHLFNARAYGDDWPEGYVEFKNRDLVAASGLSRVTVLRTRIRLAERGIIDFIPGDGSVHTAYKMRYISVEGAPVAADCRRYGENAGAVPVRAGVQIEQGGVQIEQGGVHDEQGGVQIEQAHTEYKKESIVINGDINLDKQEEEDIYNNNINGRARDTRESMYEEVIGDSYRTKVGRAPTPQEVQSIAEIAQWNRADASLVREAIERGASANYPSKYAVTCLMSWGDTGLRTLEELETYERFSQMASMTRPDIAAKGREKLSRFLKDIEIKHRMVAV